MNDSRYLKGAALAMAIAFAAPLSAQDADRYIVKFNRGQAAVGRGAVAGVGGQILLNLGPQNAIAARIPAHALAALQNNPNIEYIEQDAVRRPLALWNDTVSGGETTPFGVQMVQADKITASAAAQGSKRVCIIDSGYSTQHADLRDVSLDTLTFTSNGGSGDPQKDSCGHGSHVAGTIAGISGNSTGVVGVVPGVKLHIVKVFGNDDLAGGNCAWTYSSNLVDALNKCTAAGANVVSMSLGGALKSRTEDKAFASAYNSGVLSIAAAGNDGNTRTSYPAGYASVVSVAAVDANEALADFSQRNADVEIAAPGVAVLSTVPWLESNTLTSPSGAQSGGHVEGAARTAGVTGTIVDGGQCTTNGAGAWGGKVVLCQRGTISFNEKVVNVKSGGGVAAVIYNNVASDATCGDFAGTLGTDVTSTLPAITLSCAEGATAKGDAGSSGTVVSNVTVPASGYEAWNGTSMATPHVSAVAALIWGCNPTKTNAQVRTALTSTARDKGAAGRDTSFGYGIVQAKAALLSLGVGACSVVN